MTNSTLKTAPPLWPKEHGAYAQFALPLAAALAMGRPGWHSLCLVTAAAALFVAHEPVLVALGGRGSRAQRHHGGRAVRHAWGWVVLALASGAVGLWLGGTTVIEASALPAVLVLILIPVVLRGAEKTLTGEFMAAGALAGAGVPVAVAGGIDLGIALIVWCTWAVAFTISTSAVRYVITTHKRLNNLTALVAASIATGVAVTLTTLSWILMFALPIVLVSWALIARPPHPRHLRRVGWTLLTGTALAAATAVSMIRVAY